MSSWNDEIGGEVEVPGRCSEPRSTRDPSWKVGA